MYAKLPKNKCKRTSDYNDSASFKNHIHHRKMIKKIAKAIVNINSKKKTFIFLELFCWLIVFLGKNFLNQKT